eukprot:CAMPEP_0175076768 /NCGR_PEP_ID=MMETSP0052_2-20121109/22948_1 /TAXON_ID=51329 ORGANISM="Polytomella parva, Strain SAG 63-3" /NCGR_SAMPLE_ID=MMETSP0052_2 /ASSEMBLY_ACC=CAM_ASM_000194 /LENGTH=589 /DNA_ID=CAMNT_0016346019 /DNA_START=103 /DNA_END=1872 /DNA_ORIENTATION=+
MAISSPFPNVNYPVSFGPTFSDDSQASSKSYASLRYDFKPANVTKEERGVLQLHDDNSVTFYLPSNGILLNPQESTPETSLDVVLHGRSEKAGEQDFIAIFNEDGSFRLEVVSSHFNTRYVRDAACYDEAQLYLKQQQDEQEERLQQQIQQRLPRSSNSAAKSGSQSSSGGFGSTVAVNSPAKSSASGGVCSISNGANNGVTNRRPPRNPGVKGSRLGEGGIERGNNNNNSNNNNNDGGYSSMAIVPPNNFAAAAATINMAPTMTSALQKKKKGAKESLSISSMVSQSNQDRTGNINGTSTSNYNGSDNINNATNGRVAAAAALAKQQQRNVDMEISEVGGRNEGRVTNNNGIKTLDEKRVGSSTLFRSKNANSTMVHVSNYEDAVVNGNSLISTSSSRIAHHNRNDLKSSCHKAVDELHISSIGKGNKANNAKTYDYAMNDNQDDQDDHRNSDLDESDLDAAFAMLNEDFDDQSDFSTPQDPGSDPVLESRNNVKADDEGKQGETKTNEQEEKGGENENDDEYGIDDDDDDDEWERFEAACDENQNHQYGNSHPSNTSVVQPPHPTPHQNTRRSSLIPPHDDDDVEYF